MSSASRTLDVLRYAAAALVVYVASSLASLSLPSIFDLARDGWGIAGGVVILLLLCALPVAFIVRAGLGISPAVLVTGAVVLVGQVALVGLAAAGVPGLLHWDHPRDEVVVEALGEAVVFALLALVPALIASVLASAWLRVWRVRQLRSPRA